MTLEEFKTRCQQDPEWAPGWDAIDRQFAALYPGQDPTHYASVSRAVFGGNQFLDTIYGRLDFLQLVGITQRELDALMADHTLAPALAERMRQDDPLLLTDLSRTKSYL